MLAGYPSFACTLYNTNGRFNITVTLRLLWPIMPPSTREALALGVDLKEAGGWAIVIRRDTFTWFTVINAILKWVCLLNFNWTFYDLFLSQVGLAISSTGCTQIEMVKKTKLNLRLKLFTQKTRNYPNSGKFLTNI